MSHLSISQALQALMPGVHAEGGPSRGHADAGMSPLQGLGSVAERLAGVPAAGPAEASGSTTGMGDSVLRGLEMSPLESHLAPSLGETLAQQLSAIEPAATDLAGAGGAEVPGQEPGAAAHTLQQMAQAAPHHDVAAERHGSANRAAASVASAPASGFDSLGTAAALSSPAPHAEPMATPTLRDAQLTPAVATLLHTPATQLRTDPGASPATEERRHRRAERDVQDEDTEDDEDRDTGPDTIPMGDDEAELELVPAEAVAAQSPLAGDPLLYQQIVSALHGLRLGEGPVTLALEELRRQRRVVLATPAGLRAGLRCPAHVDVLWPLPAGGRAVRLAGELLWSQVASDAVWLEAHLVKSQGRGNVRQLVPVASQAEARRVAVCLGVQAVPMTAWSQACLRVRDSNRLWSALGPQWSLRLVVASQPLVLQGQHTPVNGAFHAV